MTTDPLLGRRFGSYVVEQKLGQGGMGAVYRAVQPEIGKQVAIKFLAPQLSQNPQVVQRFFAEARAVNLIQHDNIVDIFDFGQIEGLSFFVMELLKGASLEAVLRAGGALSSGRTVDVALQVADAIAAAHAREIVHRDLKPDNIFLVTRAGRGDFVKLLDFGIAKLQAPGAGAHTMAGTVMGTPGYMSPEQATGGDVDARTDVYALGVILYRMLAGRLPFEGTTFSEILQRQLSEPPPSLRAMRPELPPALLMLVHQMISRDPAERPSAMIEVLDRLRPLEEARPSAERLVIGYGSGAVPAIGDAAASGAPSTTLSGATGQRDRSGLISLATPPSKKRVMLVAGIGVVVATAATLGVVGLNARRSAAPAPVAAAPGEAPASNVAVTDAPAVTPPAVRSNGFAVYLETDPAGAQIVHDGERLGQTPAKVQLRGERATLILRLAGFRDEPFEVTPETEHAIVRLHPEEKAEPRVERTHAPPVKMHAAHPRSPAIAPAKKPAIGLDD